MSSIDLSYLNSIAAGDKSFIRDLLLMFRKSTPGDMNEVRRFYAAKDYYMVGSTAHKIKAPVEMLGQPELVRMLINLEKVCRDKELDKIPALIEDIAQRLETLDKEVEELIATLG
jgi:HPt (histidine-containing phosphotransfer) domain-containing protein